MHIQEADPASRFQDSNLNWIPMDCKVLQLWQEKWKTKKRIQENIYHYNLKMITEELSDFLFM